MDTLWRDNLVQFKFTNFNWNCMRCNKKMFDQIFISNSCLALLMSCEAEQSGFNYKCPSLVKCRLFSLLAYVCLLSFDKKGKKINWLSNNIIKARCSFVIQQIEIKLSKCVSKDYILRKFKHLINRWG